MHTGGAGAPAADAWLTTVHIGDLGLCYLDSVEIDELCYPLRVVCRHLLTDTEGAGRHCGAPSGLAEYGPVGTTLEAWFASDGVRNPPQGIRGGGTGGGAAQFKRGLDGRLEPVAACGGVRLSPGETLVAITCGGGGYGVPAERDPALVRRAVAEGLISRARATAVYGGALDEPDQTVTKGWPLTASAKP
jgi:N-methylhydantoinase B